MQTLLPRRARWLAIFAILALLLVWFSPPLANPGYPSWANVIPSHETISLSPTMPSSLSSPMPSSLSSTMPLSLNCSTPLSPSSTMLSVGGREVIREKVAVIVEDRPLTALVPVILHFHAVLGPSWPIVLFTRPTANFTSAPFLRAVNESRILIKHLPDDIRLKTSYDVSFLMTQSWIWEQLAPAKHVLIFQADSIICSNSPQRVEDFFKYDLIGAPISEYYGEGYNGGLSMRNREISLEIIRTNDWVTEKDAYEQRKKEWKAEMDATGVDVGDGSTMPGVLAVDMEDQWFYQKMKAMGSRLPTANESKIFSVETIYYEWPLGYHQVQRYYGEQEDRMSHIDKWCPEHRLCTDDFIYLHPHGDEEEKEKNEENEETEEPEEPEEPEESEESEEPEENEGLDNRKHRKIDGREP